MSHAEPAYNPAKPASSFEIREALDSAVRSLAVSAGTLRERLQVSGSTVLTRLRPADFSADEDRELFDRIATALTRLNAKSGHDLVKTALDGMSDTTAEQVASDILDLRDTMIGRAIRDARLPSRSAPSPPPPDRGT